MSSRSTSAMDFDYSEEYQQPQITIDKILICGFLAIEKVEVQFDKHTNLITGANEVSLSILEAIDFVLNSSYQDTGRALKCRNNINGKPTDFYVTVRISGNVELELNGVNGKVFEVTRYLHEKRIDRVYIKRVGIRKIEKLAIEAFHGHLYQLQFKLINELVISERSCQTSFDLNNTFVDALNLNSILDMMKTNDSSAIICNFQAECQLDLMHVNKVRMDVAEEHLMEIRTLEAAILTHELNAMKSIPTEEYHIANDQQRKIIFQERVNTIDKIQRKRFDTLGFEIQTALSTDWVWSIDLIKPFSDSINEFMAKFNGHMDGLKNAKMAELIRRCANQRVTIASCEKYITKSQNRLKELRNGKQRPDEIIKNIEDRRQAVEKDMATLKDLDQKSLDNKISCLKIKRSCLFITNEMAQAQLSIDKFFSEQIFLSPGHIQSWRIGFLQLEKAKRDKIPLDFVGNVFDYINPHAKLNIALPLLAKYFAMFFFKTEQGAAAFKELVEPLVQNGLTVYAYVVNDVDQERLRDLPIKYESLASHVLSEETQAQHPFIKKWFDNFRVNTSKGKADPQLALKHVCKIIDGNKCYHEDGGFSEVFNGKSDYQLQVFLEEWQKAAKERDIKLKDEAVDTVMAAAKLNAEHKQLMEQCQRVKMTINEHILQIARDMMSLVENLKLDELIVDHEILIEISQKMKESLEAGNATPQIELPEVSQRPRSLKPSEYPKEFEKNAKNIMDSFIEKGKLQLDEDAIEKFTSEIKDIMKSYPLLKKDYKLMFKTLPERQDHIEIDRKVHEHNMIIKEIQENVCKLGNIKKFPELLKMDKIDELATKSLEELQSLKKDLLDRSRNIIVPEPDANFEAFLANRDFDNYCALAKSDPQTENINANNELLLVKAYFDSLITVLKRLNGMVNVTNTDNEKEMIGFEVTCGKIHFHVFDNTEDIPYNDISLKGLCSATGLFFINKALNESLNDSEDSNESEDSNDDETIVTSNMTKLLHHRYSLLFQMLLSIWMNPSLVILNKSIIGHPIDELRQIIQRFQMVRINEGAELTSRQVIVIERPRHSYGELFEHMHKRIECINGKKVDHKYVPVPEDS